MIGAIAYIYLAVLVYIYYIMYICILDFYTTVLYYCIVTYMVNCYAVCIYTYKYMLCYLMTSWFCGEYIYIYTCMYIVYSVALPYTRVIPLYVLHYIRW